MEKAVSSEKLERFTAGEAFAVDPDAVERELASLWRVAGKGTQTSSPVTRACLLNVVALLEEREGREGFGAAESLQAWIDELPRHVAARALIVRSQPNPSGQTELQSWISANCIIAEGGGKLVCSEEVTIAARGDADHHIPGLTRALLVPGLPTSVVFSGIPHGALADPVLRLADRVITDVDASTHQEPLTPLGRVTRDGRHSGMDLGWIRSAALRSELAGVFDPPLEPRSLRTIRTVRCEAPPSVQWSSRLLLGWLALSLGAEGLVRTDGGTPTLQRTDGSPLALELVADADADGPSFSFVSPEWATPVAVRCVGAHLEASGPHLPTTRRPRQELEGPAALARALIHRSEDAAFRRALEIAEALP